MKLRKGAVYHDGTPIDAASVKANLDRARTLPDSNRKSELVTRGQRGRARCGNRGPASDGARCVRCCRSCRIAPGMMISPASFDKDPGSKPVCSGPYKFKERVQNDRIVLEKFPQVLGCRQLSLRPRASSRPFRTPRVRLNNLRAGDLNYHRTRGAHRRQGGQGRLRPCAWRQ